MARYSANFFTIIIIHAICRIFFLSIFSMYNSFSIVNFLYLLSIFCIIRNIFCNNIFCTLQSILNCSYFFCQIFFGNFFYVSFFFLFDYNFCKRFKSFCFSNCCSCFLFLFIWSINIFYICKSSSCF